MASLMAGLEDDGDHGDDTFQKEVEEEDGGGAAEQTVEHQEDFSSNGGRSGHPEPWIHTERSSNEQKSTK